MKVRSHVLLFVVVTLLAACGPSGSGGSSDSVSIALDWYPWSNHTGLFLADKNGYFTDENLGVEIYVPANPEDVLKLVGSGKDTFGISYQTDVLLAREQGIKVQSIAALVQHPLNSVMTLKESGIERPMQLEGKKIGFPGLPSDEALLATMLEADGTSIDKVEMVNVGFDLVPALIGKRVDAIIGAYWVHESILAEQQGHPVNIMRVEEWGVPDYYELVLVASDETVQEQPEMVQRFLTAVGRGYQAAEADHKAALDAVIEEYPETDRALEEIGMERLTPLWTDGAPSFGVQTAERWNSYADWMKSRGLLGTSVDAQQAFTNEFVAEAGTATR